MSNNATYLPEHGPVDENGREILLSLKNVDITFGKGDNAVKAVKNASFDIYKGETFSLVGESGSGKTTIGRAVIRVNPCAAGEIQYKGVRISGKTNKALDREVIRNIQMVFQDPAASLNERATVDYIVSEGLYNFKLFKDEADRCWSAARASDPLSPRILRRSASENRYCPCNGHGTRIGHRRRAYLCTGRFHPCTGSEPDEEVPEGT